MEITNKWVDTLHAWGIHGIMLQIITVAAILVIAFILDYVCRRGIIPMIQKVVRKTKIEWDDYLLNDKVLDTERQGARQFLSSYSTNRHLSVASPRLSVAVAIIILSADVFTDLYCGSHSAADRYRHFFLIRVVEPERQTERPPAERRLSDVEDDRDRRGRHHYLQSAVG